MTNTFNSSTYIKIAMKCGAAASSIEMNTHLSRQTQTLVHIIYVSLKYIDRFVYTKIHFNIHSLGFSRFTYIFICWFLALAHVHGSNSNIWIIFAEEKKYDFASEIFLYWMGWLAQWTLPSSKPIQSRHRRVASGNRKRLKWKPNTQWQTVFFLCVNTKHIHWHKEVFGKFFHFLNLFHRWLSNYLQFWRLVVR